MVAYYLIGVQDQGEGANAAPDEIRIWGSPNPVRWPGHQPGAAPGRPPVEDGNIVVQKAR
ncbi:MAG TPA: hypothetical protein VD931_01925 [Baekduia sp.]|nr:hypothetical protein [Baekduia sp.]